MPLLVQADCVVKPPACVWQVQTPACPWEFYITRELNARLSSLQSDIDVVCLSSLLYAVHFSTEHYFGLFVVLELKVGIFNIFY